MPGDRLAVFADSAVLLRRNDRHELRGRIAVRVEPGEKRARELGDPSDVPRRRDVRVERVEVERVGERQHVRLICAGRCRGRERQRHQHGEQGGQTTFHFFSYDSIGRASPLDQS